MDGGILVEMIGGPEDGRTFRWRDNGKDIVFPRLSPESTLVTDNPVEYDIITSTATYHRPRYQPKSSPVRFFYVP